MSPTSRSNQPPDVGGSSGDVGGSPGVGGSSPNVRTSTIQVQEPVQYYLTEPVVVYDYSKKKKRKRKKYSRGLKTIQRTEDGLTLAGRRLGDAIESGFRSYRKRRNKSERQRKDGPLRDFVRNTAGGASQFFSVGSDIPYDVARKVNNRRFGKQFRDTVRFFTAPFGLN